MPPLVESTVFMSSSVSPFTLLLGYPIKFCTTHFTVKWSRFTIVPSKLTESFNFEYCVCADGISAEIEIKQETDHICITIKFKIKTKQYS